MKKITLYILLLLVPLIISGCTDRKKFRIGVSQCSSDDWRSKMNDEIMREAMMHPEIEVEIRSADDSNEKQIADIDYFKKNNFDIIIASPREAEALTPAIESAYKSGTPVVIFDRDINGDSYTSRVVVDNERIGQQAAEYAYHLVGKGGKVLEIKGLEGSTPTKDRSRGFHQSAEKEGLQIIGSAFGNWNQADATKAIDSLLDKHGSETDLIYAHNDRMAIAASERAKARGFNNIKVIGIDAAPNIGVKAVSEGKIDATFIYPTEGHILLRTALKILNKEPFDRQVNLPVSSAVDKTNADILLLQSQSIAEETGKITKLKSQVDDYLDRETAQTSLFYASIAIMLLLSILVFVLIKAMWQRRRHQEQLEAQNRLLEEQRDRQKELNTQLEEATKSKLVFFTNVSHDLRTPLTLISEPVEQLAAADNLTDQQKTLMRIADKNVRILRRLINQILDFRKYENGKLDLHLSEMRFGEVAHEWADAFSGIARKRDIKLTTEIDLPKDFTIALDAERIERVFFNLMSNAFKYTRDNGAITFRCRTEGGKLLFSVSDTGKGISAEDQKNIFDRFFQVDKIKPNGSGIGLSLAKAFVELHGGEIKVESRPEVGSTFTVELPIRHVSDKPNMEIVPLITSEDIESEIGDIRSSDSSSKASNDKNEASCDKPILLVIDDNADIRRLVAEMLKEDYDIISAPNGSEGVRLAAKYVPDIIICDVMMPVMDGLECTRKIKEEVSTSHIPVLMLTACSMDEQRAEGYESGADGYISKPFNMKVLRARIDSLIANRRRIKEVYGASPLEASKSEKEKQRAQIPAADASQTNDIESEFYNRFYEIVMKEMGNPDLNVDSLASKMGLGRSQFYRKIKALTNYSPVELLRNMRLKQARELLTTTEKTISEIAYEVGFSTPAYFTRCFREVYSETPSDLRDRLS